MIINIRGTHGSGKSTVVRNIMQKFPVVEEIRTAERRRPWGYLCKNNGVQLFIPGHYETLCGGCDSIPVVEDIFALVHKYASQGHHVLFEGILAQHYALKKFLAFKPFGLKVFILNTTLEQCIADTKKRREENGTETTEERLAKLSETIAREYRGVTVKIVKLRDNDVPVEVVSREEAESLTLELLRA